ncbi:hypothetical protein KKF61_08845 [Patescibacteria group bacterium]|nr:hypothetical protein [Patescibacteria group bacterium]
MAVLTCKEIHQGREGGDAFEKTWSADDTRVFRVTTSSNYDGPTTVLNYATIPAEAAQHPDNVDLYVSQRRAVNESFSKTVWLVTVSYKTFVLGKSENPLADPVEITWNSETETVPVFYDKDGGALLNSAGDYFIDGPTGEFSNWTVKMKRNFGFIPQWILTYRDAVNSDNVYIDGLYVAVRTAKVSGLSISQWQQRNKIWFRSLELTVKIKSDWASHPLQQGLYQIWPGGFGRLPCKDDHGAKATIPMLLDADGLQIPADDITPAAAVHGTFYIYNELPFSYFLY